MKASSSLHQRHERINTRSYTVPVTANKSCEVEDLQRWGRQQGTSRLILVPLSSPRSTVRPYTRQPPHLPLDRQQPLPPLLLTEGLTSTAAFTSWLLMVLMMIQPSIRIGCNNGMSATLLAQVSTSSRYRRAIAFKKTVTSEVHVLDGGTCELLQTSDQISSLPCCQA